MIGYVGYVLLAVLAFLALSVLDTDGKWGRGVRGAVSELRADQSGGVRGKLSAAAEGARLGWQDKTPSTRRTVGKTPPQDSLLTSVLGKLGRVSSRAVRKIRDTVSGQPEDTSTSPMLLVRPDGTAEHIAWDESSWLPRLRPGERIHWLDRFGAIDDSIGSPITYDDQMPGGFDHNADISDLADESEPDTLPTGWLSMTLSCMDPFCGAAQTFRAPYDSRAGLSWEVIKANWLIVDDSNGSGWCPEHRPDKATYTPYDPNDPETRAFIERVLEAKLARLERFDTPDAAIRPAAEQHEGDGMTHPSNGSGHGSTAGAIENLPDYRRYLAAALTRALGELEDAQAGAQRHRDQAVSIAEGVSRLIALKADPATVAEGNRVAEQAQMAAEASTKLATQLSELVDSIKAAIDGARRHDQVQESHDSGVHLDREAYQGA